MFAGRGRALSSLISAGLGSLPVALLHLPRILPPSLSCVVRVDLCWLGSFCRGKSVVCVTGVTMPPCHLPFMPATPPPLSLWTLAVVWLLAIPFSSRTFAELCQEVRNLSSPEMATRFPQVTEHDQPGISTAPSPFAGEPRALCLFLPDRTTQRKPLSPRTRHTAPQTVSLLPCPAFKLLQVNKAQRMFLLEVNGLLQPLSLPPLGPPGVERPPAP